MGETRKEIFWGWGKVIFAGTFAMKIGREDVGAFLGGGNDRVQL